MANEKLGNWIEGEVESIKKQREEKLAELGFRPILKLKKGINNIEVDFREQPKTVETKFGKTRVVILLFEPADHCIMATTVLYSQILEETRRTGNTNITLLKSGEGEATRIELIKDEVNN